MCESACKCVRYSWQGVCVFVYICVVGPGRLGPGEPRSLCTCVHNMKISMNL